MYIESMRGTETLAFRVGDNARTIRHNAGATLEQVAKLARQYGLPWNTARVALFEAGGVAPTFLTYVVVAEVLGRLGPDRVKLADLLAGHGRVALSDELSIDLGRLRGILAGQPVKLSSADVATKRRRVEQIDREATAQWEKLPPALRKVKPELWLKVRADFTESDERAARSLGVDRDTAARAMAKRWGSTFVAERDARAAAIAGANPQHRGRISRALKQELREVLGNDD
jgi:hypothetical protein